MDKLKILALGTAIASIALSVAGCAIQRAETASKAQATMAGMSKGQVLSCMGTPVRAGKAGDTEVWTYESGDNQTNTFGSASALGHVAFGSSTSETLSCKIDVVMNEGRVTRINYSGPTGGLLTAGEECGYAVDNCVQQSSSLPTALPSDTNLSPSSNSKQTTDAEAQLPQSAPQMQSLDQWNKAHAGSRTP